LLSKEDIRKALKLELSRRIRDGEFDVPLLPHIANQVLTTAHNPNVSFKKLTELIEQDQFITGRLIHIANSPVYKGLHEVTSVHRAVVMLGLRVVTDLIFSLSVGSKVFRSRHFSKLMNQLWQHSVACAFVAQEIARDFGGDTENAFLCGLLHDIGKPLIIDTISKMIKRHPDKFELGLLDESIIGETLSQFHCQVGGLIGRKWAFPERLTASIVFHHDPIKDGEVIPDALIAGVANLFCHRMGLGCPEEPDLDLRQHPWMKMLGIGPGDVTTLEKELHGQVILFISTFL